MKKFEGTGIPRVGACAVVIALSICTAETGAEEMKMWLGNETVDRVVKTLVEKHGKGQLDRISRGVRQAAMFWREDDGTAKEFQELCLLQFIVDEAKLKGTLDRFDRALEAVVGHEVAMTRTLREPIDLDWGENLPADLLIASLDPFDHFYEDVFRTKVAFAALLNFPLYNAEEIAGLDRQPSRREWSEIRLAQAFSTRVPGDVAQEATRVYMSASHYIDGYNIHTKGLVTGSGDRPFPDGPALITHWGLRDHLKAMYADAKTNLDRQLIIRKVMDRIILQEIPAVVIDNPDVDWDPVSNKVLPRKGSSRSGGDLGQREQDERYRKILGVFEVEREIDRFSPAYPTYMSRRFDRQREIPGERVRELLTDVLDDPVVKDVAALIRDRLGRPLEDFDIWYDGFKVRGAYPEDKLNRMVRDRYPDLDAFQQDLPGILAGLGFDEPTAGYLADRIAVDPARGAGHAMGAQMRTDKAHLRTRVPKGGMDYKGFNIAMHELGHTVEQTFSLYRVDSVLMNGVPNNAFTEAMAFLFQKRDLDVLGLGKDNPTADAMWRLDVYWATREIAGVALVDMAMWNWMYEHQDASPAALRKAVVEIAKDVWNRYYAQYFDRQNSALLAVYSHMVAYALYLPDYPIGHLIQFQIEEFIRDKNLAKEMERMCVQGRLTPDAWMLGAVGSPLSARPLLDSAAHAVKQIDGK